METQFLLKEVFTNGLDYNALSVISLICILCGILVIVNKNPIFSILFLIGLFITIAVYLMMLGINFIALSYLLVYVGAVSILFLFILMLINVRISELATENNNSVLLALMVIGLVSVSQFSSNIIPSDMITEPNASITEGVFNDNPVNSILTATYFSWDGRLSETFHITTIGNIIYTNYPIWLILTSIILLLAMIGSILITLKS